MAVDVKKVHILALYYQKIIWVDEVTVINKEHYVRAYVYRHVIM